MYGNNGYPQGGNNGGYQPPQQQQGQGGDFWPNVTGFKIGPTKSGKGHSITFTINAQSRSKNQPMTFAEFMSLIQKAFQESGGNGVRLVLPFHQGQGPRGPFQSATIGIFPNNPSQHFDNRGGGGGRRQYPPQQQGYGQPQQQQGYYPPTMGVAPNQPQVPPQQQYPQGVPQGTPQGGQMPPGPPTPAYQQGGNGQNVQNGAYPSDEQGDGPIPF